MAEGGYNVTLNVYDLSQGLARQHSTTFLGKVIEVPMIQNLETTLKVGAVPQLPQFRPPMAAIPLLSAVTADNSSAGGSSTRETQVKACDKAEFETKSTNLEEVKISEKTEPLAIDGKVKSSVNVSDPLGNARSKIQEEIGNEFAVIMTTGTLRANEAATLATKRVMQRYGHLNVAVPRG